MRINTFRLKPTNADSLLRTARIGIALPRTAKIGIALLLTVEASLAVSCGGTTESNTGTTTDNTSAAETVTETTIAAPDLPEADFDGAAMLDIILGSVRFDFANLYNLAGINAIFYKGAQTGINTFMSDYEAKRSALETEFEKTMATFDTNTTG